MALATIPHVPRTRSKKTPVFRWLGPLSPALVLLLLFFAGPVIWSVYLSRLPTRR